MANIVQRGLFSWEAVDSSREILRLERVLEALPDKELMECLEKDRKGKRDDYPIIAMWNSLIAAMVCGHRSMASLCRELKRNAELRQVCGFDPLLKEDAVPPAWVYSRFFTKLFKHEDVIEKMFEKLVDKLVDLFPDYGVDLGIDGKSLPTYGRKDNDADWGVKKYKGINKDGTPYETVKKWFGYRVHLICDVNYELPVAFYVTTASEAESPKLMPMIGKLEDKHPDLLERTETLSGDRGYDGTENKKKLYDEYGIKPLIDTRDHFSDKPAGAMRPLNEQFHDTIYYSPTGELCCKVEPFSPDDEKRYVPMQFMGFEEKRKTLKFRCPAAAYGIECNNKEACQSNFRVRDGNYGRVVRVPLERNRRLFLPIHRHSRTFKKTYKKRTAVERVNSRIDNVYGFERHFIRGRKKMKLRITLAMAVMLATAAAWVEAERKDNVRSLLTAA